VPNLRRVEYLGRTPVFFLIPFDFVVSTHRQDCDFAFEMLIHDFTPPLKPTLQKIPFRLWIQPCTLGPDAFVYVHNVPGPDQYFRLGVIVRDGRCDFVNYVFVYALLVTSSFFVPRIISPTIASDDQTKWLGLPQRARANEQNRKKHQHASSLARRLESKPQE